ncbi:MAG: succinylglutamate desuccinylase/aspartoacylase [Subtercola sp.]|nr:succinylglutamate desuccinylase/aspartoacylase [Subtercola sp.]
MIAQITVSIHHPEKMSTMPTTTQLPVATGEPNTTTYVIDGISTDPGTRKRDVIKISEDASGELLGIPVIIVNGAFTGPVLAIQAGIHGDEYDGQQALRLLLETIDPATLRGTLVAIPCLNTPAFNAAARESHIDHANLNRIFPGTPEGSYSLRLADAHVNRIIPAIDILVDLHTGGQFGEITPLAIVQRGYEDIATDLGLAAGHKVIWKGGAWGGTARASALAAGKPAVTLEVGGGTYSDKTVQLHLASLVNIMRTLNMIDGEAIQLDEYDAVNATFARANVGGFYVDKCQPGDRAKKGDELAVIINHYGDVLETILAPEDGVVIWVRRLRTIHPGEETIIFGPVENKINP